MQKDNREATALRQARYRRKRETSGEERIQVWVPRARVSDIESIAAAMLKDSTVQFIEVRHDPPTYPLPLTHKINSRGRVVIQRYRNPANPAESWSGRGRPPQWVQDWKDAGRSIDELEIKNGLE